MASDNSRLEEEVAGSMGSMTATSVVFDGKKIRKPYTITKSRESWTDEEHDRFITALRLFDRDWKSIEEFVGTKSAIQIRSHAQKYFLKVQKYGTGEHVPPPRPKRKSVNPYPRKASNIAPFALGSATAIQTAPLTSQSATAFQVSSYLLEPGYIFGSDSSIALSHNSACPHGMHMQKENIMPPVGMMVDNCYGSSESPTSSWPICKTNVQRSHVLSVPENIMPPVGMMVDNCYGSSESPTSSWPIFKTNVQRSHVLSVPENIMPPVGMMVNNCYGNSESPTSSWPICETDVQRSHVLSVPAFSCGFVNEARPAIAQVYNFIGSIFDPNSSGHLQKLREMDPAVIGLILSGMRNLSINLTSPGCEDYRKVLASCAASSAEVKLDNANVSFQAKESASDSFISKR